GSPPSSTRGPAPSSASANPSSPGSAGGASTATSAGSRDASKAATRRVGGGRRKRRRRGRRIRSGRADRAAGLAAPPPVPVHPPVRRPRRGDRPLHPRRSGPHPAVRPRRPGLVVHLPGRHRRAAGRLPLRRLVGQRGAPRRRRTGNPPCPRPPSLGAGPAPCLTPARPGGSLPGMALDELAGRRVVSGACPHDCPDACSMLVTVEAGRVVGVRGDPAHPFTRGSLCAKVNDYETRVYHPDRVLRPMRRTGAKGEGRFAPISWAEAIDEICGRFRSITAEFGSEAVLPYSYAGNMALLNGIPAGDAFMHRLGASILERTVCGSCQSSALVATVGPAFIDPESLVHSRYILIWGANVLSSNQHLWPFIREARRRGAKVVVIDAYRTRTAAQADWFIPIRPGTDGALALGLIHVVVAEGLVEEDYVALHTTGFEELAERAAAFPPERVAELTGVPAPDIATLARAIATIQPSVIRTGIAPERHAQGGAAYRAIFSLPALVGSWRHVGGGIQQMPVWGFPIRWNVLTRPEWIRPGTRVVNMMQLGRALSGGLGLDPPVKALLVYNANPAVAAPEQALVTEGLARDDLFTVVHDLFVTDTARYADILLPATTTVEHFDLTWSYGHLYLNANIPAIEPRGEAVSNTELFRRLAAGMGFTDEWFGLTDEEMADAAVDWSSPAAAGLSLDRLKEHGWARLAFPAPEVWAPH